MQSACSMRAVWGVVVWKRAGVAHAAGAACVTMTLEGQCGSYMWVCVSGAWKCTVCVSERGHGHGWYIGDDGWAKWIRSRNGRAQRRCVVCKGKVECGRIEGGGDRVEVDVE